MAKNESSNIQNDIDSSIELIVISKLVTEQDDYPLSHKLLNENMFWEYKEEFGYILHHYKQFNEIPSVPLFLNTFKDSEGNILNLLEVTDSWTSLIDEFSSYVYSRNVSEKLENVSLYLQNGAYDVMVEELKSIINLGLSQKICGADLNDKEVMRDILNEPLLPTVTTGIPGLDDLIGGWNRGEEFVVFFARTGSGKTWLLIKSALEALKSGLNVGFISPEMSKYAVLCRFLALDTHFSYTDLMKKTDMEEINKLIDNYSKKPASFIVASSEQFHNEITIPKLETFCVDNKLDMLVIDGLKYIRNVRGGRNQVLHQALTEISEDLMTISRKLSIPVLVAVQANRGAAFDKEDEDAMPDIHQIKDSDGISHNATKVIAIRQQGTVFKLKVQKNRYFEGEKELSLDTDLDLGIIEVRQLKKSVKPQTVNLSNDDKFDNEKSAAVYKTSRHIIELNNEEDTF